MTDPRYPDIEVSIRSPNPLALVAAVREAMRRARVDRAEIRRFSSEAFTAAADPRQVCGTWVRVRRAGCRMTRPAEPN